MPETKQTNQTISMNPANGETLGKSKINTRAELEEIISKARVAQKEWAETPLKIRTKKVLQIRNFLVNNIDKLSEIISRDNGKVRVDALTTEVLPAAMAVTYYCKKAAKYLKKKKFGPGNIFLVNKRGTLSREPYGVVGIISPWNYPFSIPFSDVIVGLLAGNSVILKTASETQIVGQALNKAVQSAGLPENIFRFINMRGSEAGNAFIELGIDKLFFTGSVPAGKTLMRKCSENLTPLSLELGGNDPMIVREDANLYRAAKGAIWGGFQNSGQSCGGVERVYVHHSVYKQFLGILNDEVAKLRIDRDIDFNVDIGCMTTKKQKDLVQAHISEALQRGAKIESTGGMPEDLNKTNFLKPVVLSNVDHEMLVMKEETFGPVITVMNYKTDEEAIKLANDSELGLTASVWGRNSRKARKVAEKLNAGAITINDHLMSHGLPAFPWGGYKESGGSRSHGEFAFHEMTQSKIIVNDILPGVQKNLWWHPYNEELYDGLKGIVEFLYAKKTILKARGFRNLLRIIPRIFEK